MFHVFAIYSLSLSKRFVLLGYFKLDAKIYIIPELTKFPIGYLFSFNKA